MKFHFLQYSHDISMMVRTPSVHNNAWEKAMTYHYFVVVVVLMWATFPSFCKTLISERKQYEKLLGKYYSIYLPGFFMYNIKFKRRIHSTNPSVQFSSTQWRRQGGARGGHVPPLEKLVPPVCPPIWDLWCKILHLSLSSGAPPSKCCAPLVPPQNKKSGDATASTSGTLCVLPDKMSL